jgi:hypothetical protein
MHRPVARIAGLVALSLALAACSSGGSSATPVPSVSAVFASGTANVQVAGPVLSYTAPLQIGRLVDNGAMLSVQYINVQGGTLTYTGPGKPGTYATQRTDTAITSLALVVGVQGAGGDVPYVPFNSIAGECSITIEKVDKTGGNATFTCTQLPSQDGTIKIDATGTFDAQP